MFSSTELAVGIGSAISCHFVSKKTTFLLAGLLSGIAGRSRQELVSKRVVIGMVAGAGIAAFVSGLKIRTAMSLLTEGFAGARVIFAVIDLNGREAVEREVVGREVLVRYAIAYFFFLDRSSIA